MYAVDCNYVIVQFNAFFITLTVVTTKGLLSATQSV